MTTTMMLAVVGCGASRNPLAPVPTGSNVIIARDGNNVFSAFSLKDGATTTTFLLNMGGNVSRAWITGKGISYVSSRWNGVTWVDTLYFWDGKVGAHPVGAPAPPITHGVPGADGMSYSTDENGVYQWRTATDSVALRPVQAGAIEGRGYWSVDAQIAGVVFAVARDGTIWRCDFNSMTVTALGQGVTDVRSVVRMPDGGFMQASPREGIWYNNQKLDVLPAGEPMIVLRQQ